MLAEERAKQQSNGWICRLGNVTVFQPLSTILHYSEKVLNRSRWTAHPWFRFVKWRCIILIGSDKGIRIRGRSKLERTIRMFEMHFIVSADTSSWLSRDPARRRRAAVKSPVSCRRVLEARRATVERVRRRGPCPKSKHPPLHHHHIVPSGVIIARSLSLSLALSL